jgi:hypothetical protein
MLGAQSEQRAGHPFEPARLRSGIDSFALVMRVTGDRPAGYVVQTIARDGGNLRMAVDYDLGATIQRVEMMMDARTLAPMAHWEGLRRRTGGETRGEVQFRNGRARGAYILSKGVIDIPIDTGLVDDDASTALLAALPLDSARSFTFRTFASPGQVEITRIQVAGIETVTVPAGRFEAYRLVVMARDTSSVFVSTASPRRIVLVRLSDGSGEMRLLNR